VADREFTESDQEFEDLIYDGVMFLKSITNYYGPEKGIEIWEAMSDAIGIDVKGAVFFKMLSGDTCRNVRFHASSAMAFGNAVPVIKAIRTYTQFGITEAKRIWDDSCTKLALVVIDDADAQRKLTTELRELGCRVL